MNRLSMLALACAVVFAAAPSAQAAKPRAGGFSGRTDVPYSLVRGLAPPASLPNGQTLLSRDSQALAFTVGGSGRRMFGFAAPICTSWETWVSFRANRRVRARISRRGEITGRLDYLRGREAWTIRVKGTFVTRRVARGTVRVSVDGGTSSCAAEGRWSARHR